MKELKKNELPVSHDLNDGKIRSRDVIVDTQVKFSSLLLEPQIRDGLAKCGYIYLSPIQQSALPLALTGSSIIAHAKSGTGKTLIYVLPILNDFVKRNSNGLQCLVLAPTREIAKQIYDVFLNVAYYVKGLQIEYFIGGIPLDMDVIKCRNCNVAIGAPGRIKHLIDMGYLKTANLELLVLDEVDALFDHKEFAIEDIISSLPSPKQLIVCTATFSSKVGDFVKSVVPSVKYTSADKLEIEEIGNVSNMLIAIKQYVAPVKKDSSSMGAMRKREKLVEILKKFKFEQCFIFVNYMTLVRSICNYLISQNFSALWICSDQNQSTRINTINKLKMNHCKILVTTDLAARGIDVHKVNLVINLGLPCPPDIYIHRMGRAGRYGSEGAVVTILSEGEEMSTFTKMISVVSTDPIDLHILPKHIDPNLSNLDIIRCLPTEGSISEDEFSFKRQMKVNQEKNAVGMQINKRVKKTKHRHSSSSTLTLKNGITDQPFSNKMTNRERGGPASIEMLNERIENFFQSLTESFITDKLNLDWSSLKVLFGLKDDHTTTDETFAFVQDPPTDLLTYALYVKQRNNVIDPQIMPCSVDEFLSLLNNGNNIFGRHSSGLSSLIREVSGKIDRPVRQLSTLDSELSESSSQVSSVGVVSLSQQFLETIITDGDERNISAKPVKKDEANVWPKKWSGSFSLAEEFADAMIDRDGDIHASSCKQSVNVDSSKQLAESDFKIAAGKPETMSPKQFFQNYKRLNSDVENKKYPNETDSENRRPKRVVNELELSHQPISAFQDSVSSIICSQNTFKEPISPNQILRNGNRSNQPSENEKQLHKNTDEKIFPTHRADRTFSLSDQFSMAINESNLKNDPPKSFKTLRKSSNDLTSRNHSVLVSANEQLPQTNIKAKHISADFNLSDQFSKIVDSSLDEADTRNSSRRHKTSPQSYSRNFRCSNELSKRAQSRNEASEKRIPIDYPSSSVSLSDQFFNSVTVSGYNRESAFDHDREAKSNAAKCSYNVVCKEDSRASSKIDKAFKPVPKAADKNILAVSEKSAEKISKPMVDDILSDQFLSAFENKELLVKPSTIPERSVAVNHSSGPMTPSSNPNVEKKSGRSFNLASTEESPSNCIPLHNREKNTVSTFHPTSDVEFKTEPNSKSIFVPAIIDKSNISAVLEKSNLLSSTSEFENSNSLSVSDNEANDESSPTVSQHKLNLSVEAPSDLRGNRNESPKKHSQSVAEQLKNYVETCASNKPVNRFVQKLTSDCGAVKDETCDANLMNQLSVENARLSENVENAIPVSSRQMMPDCKGLDSDSVNRRVQPDRLNLHCADQIAVPLPSLQPFVSSQQEQNIWQHHFAFIRQRVVSRSRVTADQR